jgi:small subunit ribosomal protein S17
MSDAGTTEARENRRKVREGLVTSDRVRHPRYAKTVQRTKKFLAHDELNDARVGDRVRIRETRPLSKRKRWHLVEVLERAR